MADTTLQNGNYQLVRGPNGAPMVMDLKRGTIAPFGMGATGPEGEDSAFGADQWDQAAAYFQKWAPTQTKGDVDQQQQQADYADYQKQVAARNGANFQAAGINPVTKQQTQYRLRPDGTIYDTVSGVSYSQNSAPSKMLGDLGMGQTAVDAATKREDQAAKNPAPPMVNGVQTNVQGNPATAERANGTVSTLPGGVTRPAPDAPKPQPAVANAPAAGNWTMPRMKLPTTVDPNSSAGNLFGAYTGTLPTPQPAAAVSGFRPPMQGQGMVATADQASAPPSNFAPPWQASQQQGGFTPPPQVNVKPAPGGNWQDTGNITADNASVQQYTVQGQPVNIQPSQGGTRWHVMSATTGGAVQGGGNPNAPAAGGANTNDDGPPNYDPHAGGGAGGGGNPPTTHKSGDTREVTEPSGRITHQAWKTYADGSGEWVTDATYDNPKTTGNATVDPAKAALDTAHGIYYGDTAETQRGKLELEQAKQKYAELVNARDFDAAQAQLKVVNDLQARQQKLAESTQSAAQSGQYTDAAGNQQATLAGQQQAYEHQIGYAQSNRADIATQQAQAGLTGYDQQGNATLARETQVSDAERANLVAQAQVGNQAAQIRLQELAQAEGQRQFNVTNEQAWRQNPSSLFDRVWNSRTDPNSYQPYFQPPAQQQGQGQQSAFTPPAQPGQQQYAASAFTPPAQGQATPQPQQQQPPSYFQPPVQRTGALSYGEIQGAGAEPPGVAAATAGRPSVGNWHPAGGMPTVSGQAYNQLNPSERQAFGAELRATGNSEDDYAFQRQRMTAAPVRTSSGFSAPRRVAAAL